VFLKNGGGGVILQNLSLIFCLIYLENEAENENENESKMSSVNDPIGVAVRLL